MNKRMSCPHCGVPRNFELIERAEKVTIRGREVAFTAQLYRCVVCKEELEAPGQLDRNLEAAREAYARIYETASPEALVALRARYGASQKAFGLILGFGELTINSYEQGVVPDSTNRLLLKLAENPIYFKAMYEINNPRIGALQRQRIEASDGFRSAAEWEGLEALAVELSARQRKRIENGAERSARSVLEQVIACVNATALETAQS